MSAILKHHLNEILRYSANGQIFFCLPPSHSSIRTEGASQTPLLFKRRYWFDPDLTTEVKKSLNVFAYPRQRVIFEKPIRGEHSFSYSFSFFF